MAAARRPGSTKPPQFSYFRPIRSGTALIRRRRILELLADGGQTSGALAAVIQVEFGISQPGVSQHLRVLRENGFTTVRAEGARRLYAVDSAPLREIDTSAQGDLRRANESGRTALVPGWRQRHHPRTRTHRAHGDGRERRGRALCGTRLGRSAPGLGTVPPWRGRRRPRRRRPPRRDRSSRVGPCMPGQPWSSPRAQPAPKTSPRQPPRRWHSSPPIWTPPRRASCQMSTACCRVLAVPIVLETSTPPQ
jgi:DNA-binding transcriptional ArsR family regulator